MGLEITSDIVPLKGHYCMGLERFRYFTSKRALLGLGRLKILNQ